jgi:hypothetical protein
MLKMHFKSFKQITPIISKNFNPFQIAFIPQKCNLKNFKSKKAIQEIINRKAVFLMDGAKASAKAPCDSAADGPPKAKKKKKETITKMSWRDLNFTHGADSEFGAGKLSLSIGNFAIGHQVRTPTTICDTNPAYIQNFRPCKTKSPAQEA